MKRKSTAHLKTAQIFSKGVITTQAILSNAITQTAIYSGGKVRFLH